MANFPYISGFPQKCGLECDMFYNLPVETNDPKITTRPTITAISDFLTDTVLIIVQLLYF